MNVDTKRNSNDARVFEPDAPNLNIKSVLLKLNDQQSSNHILTAQSRTISKYSSKLRTIQDKPSTKCKYWEN